MARTPRLGYARRVEPERPWSLEAVVAETHAEVGSLRRDLDGVKVDIRELRGEVRSDLQELRTEVRSDLQELRTEVRSDIALFRSESRTDTVSVRTDLRGEIAELRHDVRRLDDRFFQMMLLQLGTLVAALASVVTAILT
jgi:archaellum component FlaC